MLIDFHSHFYPQVYLDALRSRRIPPYYRTTGDGGFLHHKEFRMPLVPDFYEQELQLKQMDADGIDIKTVSLANPWVDCFSRGVANSLARKVNLEVARFVKDGRGRFHGLATLPLKDPEASRLVLRESVKKLGLKGAIISTHLDDSRIDEKRYWPIFEEASRLDVPIFIHPTEPKDAGIFHGPLLVPSLAFPFETAVAAVRIVYSGLLAKYPKLKLFIPHLGGSLPYVISRIDKGYELSSEAKRKMPEPPSSYIRRNFYTDTIVFDKDALRCGLAAFDPSHVLMGTDYPFSLKTEVKRSLGLLESLRLPSDRLRMIRYENARDLLKSN